MGRVFLVARTVEITESSQYVQASLVEFSCALLQGQHAMVDFNACAFNHTVWMEVVVVPVLCEVSV